MYLYNVTIKVENHRVDEWIDWMKNVHIPEVMATGYFIDNRMCRLLNDNDPDGETFAIQYTALELSDYEEYQKIYAPALQQKTKDKFGDDFVAFRTIMEIL